MQVLTRGRQLLAEGLCDLAVVRTPPDERRLASAVVGPEQRYCALAPTFGTPSLRPLHRQQREPPLPRQIPHRGLSGTSRSRTLAWIAVRQIRSLVLSIHGVFLSAMQLRSGAIQPVTPSAVWRWLVDGHRD